MPIITEGIQQRAFELIRDRIGQILADELTSQASILGDSNLNASVFVERFVPFQNQEMPAINVMVARGDYGVLTSISEDGTFIFNIDVYTTSKTNTSDRGDNLSASKLHRLMGVCHAILSHWRYRTLQFAKPFIEHVEVNGVTFAEPLNNQDASSVVMGRLSFHVRVPDNIDTLTPNTIDGYSTAVQLENTALGYLWGDGTVPLLPPSCAPGDVFDSAPLKIGEAPSGGGFIVIDSVITNSDSSFSQNVKATQPYELPDESINVYVDGDLNTTATYIPLSGQTINITA